MRCGGNFVIYHIWRAMSVCKGAISAGYCGQGILKFGIDSNNKNFICHFGTKSFDVR